MTIACITPTIITGITNAQEVINFYEKGFGSNRVREETVYEWARYFLDGEGGAFKAEIEDLIVGITGWYTEGSFTMVHPDYRQKGIGSQLMERKQGHLKRYHTKVWEGNVASLATISKFETRFLGIEIYKGKVIYHIEIIGGTNYGEST